MTGSRRWNWWSAGSLLAFIALTLLVLGHVMEPLDLRIRQDLNPSAGYGAPQWRALRVAHWMRPTVLMAVFVALAALAAALRRSLRQFLFACGLVLVTAVCELGLKWVLPRVGSDGGATNSAETFPSGHVLCAVIVPGGLLLMLTARTRWWQWVLVAVLPAVMVVAVMLSVLHWASDVVGGVLLGVFLLSASASTPLRPSRPWRGRTGTAPDGARPAGSRTS